MKTSRDPVNPSHSKTSLVSTSIKQQIAAGQLPLGSRLPPIRQLASLFGVSKVTANLAIRELEKDGWVNIQPRKGAIVRKGKAPQPMPLSPVKLKFEQVAEQLEELIGKGDIKAREPLPTRKALCYRYGISPATLCRALKLAEQKGLIHRRGSMLFAGPSTTSRSETHRKVFVLPAWSRPQNRQIRHREPRRDFMRDFEKELSRYHLIYVGKYDSWPSGSKRTSAGYFYPCSRQIVVEVSDNSQSLMEKELTRINRIGRPVILYNHVFMREVFPRLSFRPHRNVFPFGVDNREAGRQTGKYLYNNGHRHVAYFSFVKELWSLHRCEGVAHAIEEHDQSQGELRSFQAGFSGVGFRPSFQDQPEKQLKEIMSFVDHLFNGYRFSRNYIARRLIGDTYTRMVNDQLHAMMAPLFEEALSNPEITAWVCSDSPVAAAAAQFLNSQRIEIPRQISMVAIDDDFELSDRAINGCDLQFDRMAYLAAHCIIGDIPIKKNRQGVVECPPRIVDRGSVARIRNQ